MTYLRPVVSSIHPPGGPEYGRQKLLIRGSGLAWKYDLNTKAPSKVMAYIDGRPCYNTVIRSSTELLCLTPPGTPGEKGEVTVIVNGVKSTEDGGDDGASDSYAYEDIHSNRIVPARGPTYGHQKIVVYGLNVGENETAGLYPTVYVGKVPCLKTKVLSKETIECVTATWFWNATGVGEGEWQV